VGETVAVAVHLEDVDVVGEPVEQGAGQALGADEEKLLNAELPGYSDYTHRVRYRLLPLVW
jgi:hypothetical protein